MISFDEAIAIALAHTPKLDSETIPLSSACHRVLSQSVSTPHPVPHFENSAMDGYAVRSETLARAQSDRPVTLPICGTVAAGDSVCDIAPADSTIEIFTGAVLPRSFDAVVRVEDATLREGKVLFSVPVAAGHNVRPAGEDFAAGATVVDAGTLLEPDHLMALAAVGCTSVSVRRRPRIAILSTGKELVSPLEKDIPPGKIRNSSLPYLEQELTLLGADAQSWGIVADEPREFISVITQILSQDPDVIITTGAVSVGRYDFIRATLRDLSAEILFHKVSIRPGKPLLMARFGAETIFFGLPGNPLSTVVGLRFLVEPFLRHAFGLPPERPGKARLVSEITKPRGLRCFFKATLQRTETSTATVRILPGQGSSLIRPLLASNAWAVLPQDAEHLLAGQEIDVYPIHSYGGGLR